MDCERRFTTYERIEFVPITVIKRNGDRESFDRSKVLKGIARACEKTSVSAYSQENVVDEIEAELQQHTLRDIHSYEIGDLVMHHLRQTNQVAYVRFASVYQKFQDVEDFIHVLEVLQQEPATSPHHSVKNQAANSSLDETETTNNRDETAAALVD